MSPHGELLGRTAELAHLADWLGHVGSGRGGCLLLTGPAGIGKSALVRAASRAFDGVVVEVRPADIDPPVPFDGLAQLLEPFHHLIEGLPDRQRVALCAAIGIAEQESARLDRLGLGLATLSLLREAATDRALLIVVDDVHQLDPASAVALAFCTRRLDTLRIGVLCTHRSGSAMPPSLGGLPQRRIGPLDHDASSALVLAQVPRIAPRVLDDAIAVSEGNPLLLRELAVSLTDDELLGVVTPDLQSTLAAHSRRLFHGVIAGLSEPARKALALRALIRSQPATVFPAALRRCRIPESAVDEAIDVGLIERAFDARFTHPLVRTAALAMSTSADVHEAHTALASCAADDDRIWHRAALAVAPDAALADELEHAARRDLRRGALHAALRAVDASTTFEPTMRQRQHRQLDALEMAIRSNSPIAELDQRIAKLEREPLGDAVLDRFELVRGLLAHRLRHPLVPALDRLERAATVSASRGSVLAVSMLADASYLSLIAGDCPRADRLAGEALALLESHPPDADRSAPALAARAMAAACRGRPDEAGARLAALAPLVGEISPDGTAVIAVPLAMLGLGVLGEHQQTHLLASAAADSARRSGALSALPSLCHAVGEASFRLGNWDAAEVESAEAVRLSQEFDQSGILVHAQAAYGRLLTHRGRFREADALLADAERAARHAGANTLLAVVGHARASRLIATGRFDEAVIALERVLVDVVRPSGMLEPSWVPALPDLVEALVMAGRVADARQVADELGDRASAYPRASVQALVARSRALVATTGSADWFVEAIELHDKEPAAHERARTALLAGEFAIAAGRQADAREHLHQASNQFALLGAEPWLARTEAALRRAGSRAAPRTSRSTELTDAERRVADAVATGLTNREISALLFVSVKTVEFHLSRVYAKLGLRGRAALARHVLTNGDR